MYELMQKFANMFKENRTVGHDELNPALTPDIDAFGFTSVGTVDRFVVYPIDCGLGFKFRKAIFTANGIQMVGMDKKYLVDDRTLIVYNKSTLEAIVDPRITMVPKRKEILLYCLAELFKQQYENLEVIHVNYLDTELPLRIFPIGSSFDEEIQNNIFQAHRKDSIGLGYCTKEDRRLLNEKHRFVPPESPSELNNLTDHEMNMAFLPNFSTYTLMNITSFKYLLYQKKTNEPVLTVNYRNFRPQIIVNLQCPFAEDNIEEIKIGEYRFNRIIPCITEKTNYNAKFPEKKFSMVYQTLVKERTLFNVYPKFAKAKDPILPIFGVNMELKQNPYATAPLEAVIERGAEVFVKYDKSFFSQLVCIAPKPSGSRRRFPQF